MPIFISASNERRTGRNDGGTNQRSVSEIELMLGAFFVLFLFLFWRRNDNDDFKKRERERKREMEMEMEMKLERSAGSCSIAEGCINTRWLCVCVGCSPLPLPPPCRLIGWFTRELLRDRARFRLIRFHFVGFSGNNETETKCGLDGCAV